MGTHSLDHHPIAEETSELMKGLTVKRLKNFLEYLQKRDIPEEEKSYNTREWLIKLIYG